MKNILVPIDFSMRSKEALKTAISLAKKVNAKLYLLYALDLPTRLATEEPNAFPETIYFLKLARQKFDEISREISFEGIETSNILETNLVWLSVEKAIEKYEIDLVVAGSNGASGVKEIFIGSNAEKIVRYSKVPVLIVKGSAQDFNVKTIVFACDLSSKYVHAMEKAISFARLFNAEIRLLYVNTPYNFRTTESANELSKSFTSHFPDFKNVKMEIYNDIRVEDGILNYVASNDIDLICMFPSGRKGIAHFFNGSVSEDLINHAQKPILTIQF